MEQVKPEAAGLVDHVVAVIELVDIDREPRDRRHNRGAHRGVGDHAVLLAPTVRGDGDDWRGEIAEQLVGEVRLEHTSRYMAASAPLPERVRAHMQRRRLFREPGTAIVAVSGGADSAALLDLLSGVARDLGLQLVVAHADHGIQMESGKVGKMVRDLAASYGLPFELTELKLGPDTTETEARRARYAWLREVQRRRGAKYLVTAHHQDDQIETIVLRALRGSAPAGLARGAQRGRGGLVRPPLPVTRPELVEDATARGLPIADEPAKREPRHPRARVRATLLPLVASRL